MVKILNAFSRKNRILLGELAKTDFKLRYQGSVLGYLWAVLRPLLMFAILYFVFAKMLKLGSDIPHYPVYLLTGTVLWNFFTECTGQGIQAIVQRGDLLRKISFPKYIVVVASTVTPLINLAINLGVVVVFALINGVLPSWSWLLVPFSILELYGFALGISFLLGAANVKYRDVTSIWDVVTQALFYAIPIIYPLSMFIDGGASGLLSAKILMLNPIAQAIQDIRHNLISETTITTWDLMPNVWVEILPIFLVIVVFVAAILFFRKKSRRFAEEV